MRETVILHASYGMCHFLLAITCHSITANPVNYLPLSIFPIQVQKIFIVLVNCYIYLYPISMKVRQLLRFSFLIAI